MYKMMLGEALDFKDVEDFDNEFYNNLNWCLNNDITGLGQYFCTEQEMFGKSTIYEFFKGGKNKLVTNENKSEYVQHFTYFKLYTCIEQQIDAFLEGFHELIPRELISIFNHHELELLISGLPYYDSNFSTKLTN